jgi:LysR family transcriptional regulator, transcriptional activator for dmlA
LHLTDRAVNLVDEGFDVLVRFGEPSDSRLTARLLAKNRRIICASPQYLKRQGEPAHPRDLGKHSCIFIRQGDETFGTWHLHNGAAHEAVKVHSHLSTNDGSSALTWALDGHGLLMRSQWEVAQYVRTGLLVPVLTHWEPPPADIYMVFQSGKQLPAKTRVAIDWFLAQFKDRRQMIDDAAGNW